MITLYHGTTYANWQNIKTQGFCGWTWEPVWSCSNREVYCYDTRKEYKDEDSCIRAALESAAIAAAVKNDTVGSLVVIRFEVPEEMVDDDYSCEYVNDIASTIQPEDIKPEHITGLFICENGYAPSLRLFYVCGCLDKDFLMKDNFTQLELDIAERVSDKLHHFYDDLLMFEWEEKSLEDEKIML